MFDKKTIAVIFSLAIPFLPSKVLAQDTPRQDYTGFAIENEEGVFQEVKTLVLDNTKECLDKASGKEIAFISDRIPAAEDRRVIITNVTKDENGNYLFGDVDALPYTDRQYERDAISEDINIAIGLEHVDNKLVAAEGKNQFQYEIVDPIEQGDRLETVVDNGQFSVMVQTPIFTSYSDTCESIEKQEEQEQEEIDREVDRQLEQQQRELDRQRSEELQQQIREDLQNKF